VEDEKREHNKMLKTCSLKNADHLRAKGYTVGGRAQVSRQPHYAWWYGWSEMPGDLTDIKELAAEMRRSHMEAATKPADLKPNPYHAQRNRSRGGRCLLPLSPARMFSITVFANGPNLSRSACAETPAHRDPLSRSWRSWRRAGYRSLFLPRVTHRRLGLMSVAPLPGVGA
jgi:hypothetical protein